MSEGDDKRIVAELMVGQEQGLLLGNASSTVQDLNPSG